MHPICLPDWQRMDLEGKYTIDRLYRYTHWEKYQVLYSLKVNLLFKIQGLQYGLRQILKEGSFSYFFLFPNKKVNEEKCLAKIEDIKYSSLKSIPSLLDTQYNTLLLLLTWFTK